ncbi:hypothetical protein MTQ10_08865 [Streptomyces sp. XM83C]|uniref:Uncharacterized protein n=1 Tax=Streptomyces thermocoprophilus TaxID=78356 RepID=A0ABV5VLT6_9ACTN|nr:hypothetical protein [Streptomyces sp. XM83C]MCK1819720.1 hypothetical protein [Streptomyces sp. XM83C]
MKLGKAVATGVAEERPRTTDQDTDDIPTALDRTGTDTPAAADVPEEVPAAR